MKNSQVFVLSLLLVPLFLGISNSQCFIIRDSQSECLFLKNINYRNKTDTITIIATFLDLGKVGQDVTLKKLEKNKVLVAKDFKYAIAFKPINCSETYYIPCRDEKMLNSLINLRQGKTITIECIIFESFSDGDHPFFIINKLQIN